MKLVTLPNGNMQINGRDLTLAALAQAVVAEFEDPGWYERPRVPSVKDAPTGGKLLPNTKYYYRVVAVDKNAEGGLPSPQFFVVTADDELTTHRITFPHVRATEDAVSYRIYRATEPGGYSGYLEADKAAWEGGVFQDTGEELKAGELPTKESIAAAKEKAEKEAEEAQAAEDKAAKEAAAKKVDSDKKAAKKAEKEAVAPPA